MTRKRNLLLLPLFLLLATAYPSSAQTASHQDDGSIERGLLNELGQFAINYWVPKFNEYRVRIDRSLRSSDLAELNALRVRWSMLIEEELKKSEARDEARAERQRETRADERTEFAPVEIAEAPMVAEEENVPYDEIAVATPVEVAPAPGTGNESASASAGVGGGVEIVGNPAPEREKEPMMVLVESAQGIAAHNRTQMNTIHDLIIKDLNTFIDQGIVMVDRFFEKNRASIRENDLDGWNEFKASLASQDAREKLIAEFDNLYTSGGESFVMLYNGVDILRILGVGLLGMAPTAAAPISDMHIPSKVILAQNAPNPARSSTAITYTLQDPSSATTLDMFDASGRTMLVMDLGARAAGEHTALVDVTKFPSGSYLYRLTVQTAQGEQVSSKVLQVAR